MANTEKRRLFIGGLHPSLTEQDLKERFGRHGTISSLQIKIKNDSKGNPIKTFAHMDITLTENELKKCMNIYNNTKWNGNIMQIQIAKESFLTRLEQERAAVNSSDKEEVIIKARKPSHQATAEKRLEENFEKAGVTDFVVKGKVPGTQIEGEKNWVVGKYGRVLPVVYIRRKDKQKVVCYDPSKYSHHLKKFKDDDKSEGIGVPRVEQLTWDLPETQSEISLKRKGMFTEPRSLSQRKKVKDGYKNNQVESLPLNRRTKKRSWSYDSDQSNNDSLNEDNNHEGYDELPMDFEIVKGTSFLPKATSIFVSKSGYESDDRESVDTDELCTLIKSSKKSKGAQKNEGERNEEALLKSPTKDKKPNVSKQCQREAEEEVCQSINHNSRTKIQSTELRKNDTVQDREFTDTGTDNYDNDNEEVGDEEKEDEESDDVDDGLDVFQRKNNCSTENDDDSDDEAIIGSPIARFDFEPLILDRSALRKSMGLETTAIVPKAENHVSETQADSDDCDDEDLKEDDSDTDSQLNEHYTEDDSDESSDKDSDQSKDHIEEVHPELLEIIHNERNNTNESTCNKLEIRKTKESKDEFITSQKLSSGTAETEDRKISSVIRQLMIYNLDQPMYDKSGRLLSKAAKKKLASEEAEKQRQANERRLESMKKQQRALLDRQGAIKGALSAVDDKEKKQGKHITFDSDEGGSDTEMENKVIAGEKIQGSLFENDEEESDTNLPAKNTLEKMWEDDDDDDDDDSDDERFRIKPQYEGEAGQKLIQMEARYGGDSRFKLDSRFLDVPDSKPADAWSKVTQDDDGESPSDLQEEKQRSLAILQSMLGTPVAASRHLEPNFKDPSQLHYDPSKDEHSKYELQEDEDEDNSDAKKLEEEMRKEKKMMEEERAKMPEVSKEKFFQVSSNLKDAFSGSGGGQVKENDDEGDGGGGAFTFFGRDDADYEDEDPDNKKAESSTNDLASLLVPSKRFRYDSSDDDDDDNDEENADDNKKTKLSSEIEDTENSEASSIPQTFFFQADDPRLAAGSQKFCRPNDQDAMMKTWEEMKAHLQNDFRKRHHKAVRDQKTSKKWLKKPAKSKK